MWNGRNENPYLGLLSLADAIVVTSDSVSMISEACFTGKPVYVEVLPDRSRRRQQFLSELARLGMVRFFYRKNRNVEIYAARRNPACS